MGKFSSTVEVFEDFHIRESLLREVASLCKKLHEAVRKKIETV